MTSTFEEWRPVPGFEGFYEVSDRGRVKRIELNGRRIDRIRKPSLVGDYLTVNLSADGVLKRFTIHTLVAKAFLGPCPEGLICRHGTGGRFDNSLGNLSYGTYSDNNGLDRVRDGTIIRGDNHHSGKLNEMQVRLLRRIYSLSKRPRRLLRDLADAWKLNYLIVIRASNGTTWQWLKQDPRGSSLPHPTPTSTRSCLPPSR